MAKELKVGKYYSTLEVSGVLFQKYSGISTKYTAQEAG
jgi:hypothetical protein